MSAEGLEGQVEAEGEWDAGWNEADGLQKGMVRGRKGAGEADAKRRALRVKMKRWNLVEGKAGESADKGTDMLVCHRLILTVTWNLSMQVTHTFHRKSEGPISIPT